MRARILHRNSESIQQLAGCPRPSSQPCESIRREAPSLSTRWEVHPSVLTHCKMRLGLNFIASLTMPSLENNKGILQNNLGSIRCLEYGKMILKLTISEVVFSVPCPLFHRPTVRQAFGWQWQSCWNCWSCKRRRKNRVFLADERRK